MIRATIIIAAALSLAACLAAAVMFFLGSVGTAGYRNILLAGTLGWFVCAVLLAGRRKGG
jgi:hypothetical protein